MQSVVAPVINNDDAYFWNGARQGRLYLQRCLRCGTLRHPATPLCAACGSLEWEPHEASGRGVVFSWLISRHPTDPSAPARIVAVIELAEGLGMVANVVGVDPADALRGVSLNDVPVEVCFEEFADGVVLPQFRPTSTLPDRSGPDPTGPDPSGPDPTGKGAAR